VADGEHAESTERPVAVDARSGLPHDAIREQLRRILAHRELHATDKMRDFLRFVVEETLAGREHRLKGYTIATRVFGRGEDFDPSHDPIVRIQAGRLRRAMERYYLVAGQHDPVFIDIPKGRYIPRFSAQAPPAAATPTGWQVGGEKEPTPPTGPSIVVLPFENLTGDPEQLFLTVGLMEELVTEMSRFQDIVVIPCWRSAQTAGSVSHLELCKAVGARFVLEGTVRRDPKVVKVSMQLTDTKIGRHIWAESYKRPLAASSLIATQEEIARSVVAAIGNEYGIILRRLSAESRKKPPAELETYDAMLRYYMHQISPGPETSGPCFAALKRAVEREPDFGPAWSALSSLYAQMYSADTPGVEKPLEAAVRYAQRGVSLEPGSQLGRLALAYVSYLADDSDTFRQEIETALTLNPNSPYTMGTAGYFHIMRGELERGLSLMDRAIAANPCYPDWFRLAYFLAYFHRRDYERALQELQKRRLLHDFWHHVIHASTLAKVGRLDEAKAHIEELEKQKPDFASRGRELFRRSLKVEPLVEDILDGVRLAGLQV